MQIVSILLKGGTGKVLMNKMNFLLKFILRKKVYYYLCTPFRNELGMIS